MGSRNLLGGPEGKAGFQNRETRTLLLWFLGRTDGMQRHWLKQKGWQRVWLLGQAMAAWGPGEEPLRLDREVMSYKRPRTCRNKVGTEDPGQGEGAWEGRGRPMATDLMGSQDSVHQVQSEASETFLRLEAWEWFYIYTSPSLSHKMEFVTAHTSRCCEDDINIM